MEAKSKQTLVKSWEMQPSNLPRAHDDVQRHIQHTMILLYDHLSFFTSSFRNRTLSAREGCALLKVHQTTTQKGRSYEVLQVLLADPHIPDFFSSSFLP